MKEINKCEDEPERVGGIFIRYVSIKDNLTRFIIYIIEIVL